MPISTIGQNGLNAPLSLTSPTIATPTFTGQATIPTINLTGGQITFPATQSASSDANTLDDYEEGTFTPTFANGTFTYTRQQGYYTKIGRLVTVNFVIIWSAKSGTGGINLAGFPFTSISTVGYRATGSVGYTSGIGFSAGTQIVWTMSESYTSADLAIVISGSATTFAQVANMSAGGEVQGTISYIV
jgi:hypothetical protein